MQTVLASTDGMDAPMGGMTMFAKGSHLIDTPLPVSNGQPVEHEAVQPPLKRGDACLFENRIFRECDSRISAAQNRLEAVKNEHALLATRGSAACMLTPLLVWQTRGAAT